MSARALRRARGVPMRTFVVVLLVGCGSFEREDLGDVCVSLEGGVLSASVAISGGETGPSAADCLLELQDGDQVRLRSTSTWQRDQTPFASNAILRMAVAECSTPWSAERADVVWNEGLLAVDEGGGLVCTVDEPWWL